MPVKRPSAKPLKAQKTVSAKTARPVAKPAAKAASKVSVKAEAKPARAKKPRSSVQA